MHCILHSQVGFLSCGVKSYSWFMHALYLISSSKTQAFRIRDLWCVFKTFSGRFLVTTSHCLSSILKNGFQLLERMMTFKYFRLHYNVLAQVASNSSLAKTKKGFFLWKAPRIPTSWKLFSLVDIFSILRPLSSITMKTSCEIIFKISHYYSDPRTGGQVVYFSFLPHTLVANDVRHPVLHRKKKNESNTNWKISKTLICIKHVQIHSGLQALGKRKIDRKEK